MKYKHIIWDWNGTLFNDAWLCVDIINNALARRNMPTITKQQHEELFVFPVIDYYRNLGFDFKKESFEVSGTEFIDEYNQRFREANLHDGVVNILSTIQNLGISQSVLSAMEQSMLNELIVYFDLSKYFINVSGLDNHYAHSKIENGIKWMEELHFGPHEVLLVGDTAHDFEVAKAIGADCLLIPSGHQIKHKLVSTNNKVISNLEAVLEEIK
jgi:phosphoglycolate phosphatase